MFPEIFSKPKTAIGALHFPPLLGYKSYPGKDAIFECVKQDLAAFNEGGIDSIIFENNYDVPHTETIAEENAELMTELGKYIKNNFSGPIGISVLWNDYKSALDIASKLDLQFIRVPVFVDSVSTSYGRFMAHPHEVTLYRKQIAKNVALFTDIHVKHAKLLVNNSIDESAQQAMKNGSDGVIVTGRWTGDSPDMAELEKVREAIGKSPIIIGSGVNDTNIQDLLKVANAAIVSTSLKEGGEVGGEVNVKGWNQRISSGKVSKLMNELNLF